MSGNGDDQQRQAQSAFLRCLRDDRPLAQITSAVAETNQSGFAADVAMLEVAVTALDVAGVCPETPLPSPSFRKYLPEIEFKNNKNRQERTRFAMYAVAAIRTGVKVDLLDDTYWWRSDPLWPYALWAAVIYIRSCSALRGSDVRAFSERIAEMLSLEL